MDPNIRDLFPAARKFTYLNSATIGPMPTMAVEAVGRQLSDVSENGSVNFFEWSDVKERGRSMIAEMLCVRSGDISFTRNTSDGLCAVAAGLSWELGDNIVTFENEFPANFYPWRDLGVEIRFCNAHDGRYCTDELIELVDHRTKLVTVSAIQYCNGYRADLERIGAAAKANDSLFAVDIIQAFGVVPLDLTPLGIDIAVGSSYKWLCAPEGCGILYLNTRARQRMKPPPIGWKGVYDPWNFQDRSQPRLDDTRAWETGMGGSALFYGFEESLKLIRSVGVEKIQKYVVELTDFLCEILPTRYSIASSRCENEKSQIVSIRPTNGRSAETIVEILREREIIACSRNGHIRAAPHFFNNFDDIEAFVDALP